MDRSERHQQAIELLQNLIRTPSFSKEEDSTAKLLCDFLTRQGAEPLRYLNNVWAFNKHFSYDKPTILLNSHHDTVEPNSGYTRDPFSPATEGHTLFGLGSNDAGGCLVSLIATFLHFHQAENLRYNLVIAATAEEEISGHNGLECLIPQLGQLDFAIVGEPTQMNLAIAEKGLLVLDCTCQGIAGHAARNEGENAIYKALNDCCWLRDHQWERISPHLGPVKTTVTAIQAGKQHNVVPDRCTYLVDVRLNERYEVEELLSYLAENLNADIQPRSTRLRPSHIPEDHPIVVAGKQLGAETYGSPTTSDQALLAIPSLKCGPGDSARSHTPDEYIHLSEIKNGIDRYIAMLEQIL